MKFHSSITDWKKYVQLLKERPNIFDYEVVRELQVTSKIAEYYRKEFNRIKKYEAENIKQIEEKSVDSQDNRGGS